MTAPLYRAELNEFTLLKFEGEDTLTFLQGQLSQDIKAIHGQDALLASYSNPKGRVFATFLLWQDNENSNTYYGLVAKDIAAFLQKRLSMFVLRAKVKISLITTHLQAVWGDDLTLLNDLDPALSVLTEQVTPALQTQPNFKVVITNTGYAIQYPSADTTQRILLIDFSNVPQNIPEYTSPNVWYAHDICIALPWINDKTKEVFVAQSINLDAIGAINFKKGCYPGQEVIARSHYLGNLKRRSVPAILETAITDATSLLASDVMQGDSPIGQVVNAVSVDDKTYLLIEVQLKALESNEPISLAGVDGVIKTLPVPYSLEKPE